MRKVGLKKTKDEISFKSSIFRFSFFFVTVAIAGLITNSYLGRIDLRDKIPKEILETNSYQVFIETPEIRFKKGLFPVVGVFSPRIEWKDKKCSSRRIVAQDVFLIFDFLSLLRGVVEPGRVDVAYADVSTPDDCSSVKINETSNTIVSGSSEATTELIREKVKDKQLPEDFFKVIRKVLGFSFFPNVYVQKFDFKLIKGYREEVGLKGALALVKEKKIELKLFVKELLFKGIELPVRKALLSVDASEESVEVELKTSVREGLLKFNASLKNDKAYNSSVSAEVTKVPLSPFSFAFFDKTQLSYLWLNCSAQVSGSWETIRQKSFGLGDCNLAGPYGEAHVNSSELTLEKAVKVEIEFNKIQFDKVVKNKRDAYFSGVFSKYGNFSSLLKFDDGRWSLSGLFEESEVIFSSNNLRDIQKLNKIPFNAQGDRKNGKIVFDKIDLDEGQLDGNLVFEFYNDFKSGSGRFSIHKLLMNPKIYKLMVLSKPIMLSFYGKVQLRDKIITDWSGLVAAKNIEGEQYKFSALKIEGRMGEEQSSLFKFSVPSGEISGESALVKWMAPTTLMEKWPTKGYQFKELSGRIYLDKNKKMDLTRGYAKFSNGWQLSAEGSIVPGEPLTGTWIQWDKPNRQYLKWNLSGHLMSGLWEPHTQWVKDWLIANPNFVEEHTSVHYSKVEPKKITDDINEMGKKTLEKVKDVLSIKPSEKKKGS